MPPTGTVEESRVKLPAAVIVAAVVVVVFIAISPARAQANEAFDDSQTSTWPNFSDELNDPCPPPPPAYTPPGWIPTNELTSSAVGTAPLPPAVMTGLLMLGGNWVITRLWKKRKI